MVNNLLELTGFTLIVLFAFVVWPPLALVIAGAGLIAAGFAGDLSKRRDRE